MLRFLHSDIFQTDADALQPRGHFFAQESPPASRNEFMEVCHLRIRSVHLPAFCRAPPTGPSRLHLRLGPDQVRRADS
jgi:hypothetical protein